MSSEVILTPALKAKQSVAILDRDIRTCEALSLLLRLEGFHTSFAVDLDTYRSACDRRKPDLLLCNAEMEGAPWDDILKWSRADHVPVILLQNAPDVMLAVDAVKAGALAVIPKPFDTERVLAVIRDEVRSKIRIAPFRGSPALALGGFAKLTRRETDVLRGVLEGKTNREAGLALQISPRTVEVHRSKLMKKLGARNTAELVRLVMSS